MNNLDKLFDVLSQVFDISVDAIDLDVSQKDVDGWDSLRMINLIVALEQSFDVKFDIVEISEMNNVSAIKNYLSSKGIQFE